jgi:hypothetical protein
MEDELRVTWKIANKCREWDSELRHLEKRSDRHDILKDSLPLSKWYLGKSVASQELDFQTIPNRNL